MAAEDERTLCAICADNYITAGYILRRCWAIVVKSTCDCCQTRTGWTYEVIRRGQT